MFGRYNLIALSIRKLERSQSIAEGYVVPWKAAIYSMNSDIENDDNSHAFPLEEMELHM